MHQRHDVSHNDIKARYYQTFYRLDIKAQRLRSLETYNKKKKITEIYTIHRGGGIILN
jgi:predicted ABC-type ATPase